MMDGRLMIGVDGGGTHTVAVAARPDGTVVDVARGEGINYNNIGLDSARRNLRALLAGMPSVAAEGYGRMCIGLSALDGPADEATTRAFAGDAFDPERLDLQSDAFVALMGLTRGGPGLIIICGTGSMLLAVDQAGNQHVMGGWGHLLGDTGSSHALAVDGLRAAIDGWEGTGRPTRLMEAALAHFRVDSPRGLIHAVYAPGASPSRIAQFGREVLRLEQSDAVAGDIARRQMRHVALQASRLLERYPEIRQVGLYGGIFAHNERMFALLADMLTADHPEITVSFPSYPPELGALIYLLRQRGPLAEEVLERLRESYRGRARTTGGKSE